MSDAVPYVLAALLDVLGYRDRLARDRESGRLDFKDALQRAMQVLSNVNEAHYAYDAISDTIIITRTDDADLAGLLAVLKDVHLAFLREGMLVRGGLAYERHFKSNNITYSHALALAHQVETDLAVYPRIVIDKNVIETQKTKNLWMPVAKSRLICECNGVHFLNVLDDTNWYQVHAWAKKIYERDRSSLAGKEKEFLKHAWFENYLFSSRHAKPDAEHSRYLPPITIMEDAST
jgi:hypothetical protein